jgi:broad specificity phosphatase PhoE
MRTGDARSSAPGIWTASSHDRPWIVLIIVRHGRTEANARGLLLGRSDPSLDETGRDQAARLASAVPEGATVVSSPLARCRETAAAFGRPVAVDERWLELDYGEWDGRPVSDVPAATWRAWRHDPEFAPPGGESLAALGARVRAAADDLVAVATDADVVVVTHVSPVKAAVAWALGVGDEVGWRTFVSPATISRIAVGERGSVLTSFNETGHLS